MIYNDFIGAFVNGVATVLGYAALAAIVATGFWHSTLWALRQARNIVRAMKEAWREAAEER